MEIHGICLSLFFGSLRDPGSLSPSFGLRVLASPDCDDCLLPAIRIGHRNAARPRKGTAGAREGEHHRIEKVKISTEHIFRNNRKRLTYSGVPFTFMGLNDRKNRYQFFLGNVAVQPLNPGRIYKEKSEQMHA
jgi:hypothetical protein